MDRELDDQANIIKTKEEIENNQQPKPRTKTQMDETILNQEEFNLKEYIKTENTKKYILLEDAKYVFNINIRRSDDGKTLTFATYIFLLFCAYLKSSYCNAISFLKPCPLESIPFTPYLFSAFKTIKYPIYN